jgi:hypothetical protein
VLMFDVKYRHCYLNNQDEAIGLHGWYGSFASNVSSINQVEVKVVIFHDIRFREVDISRRLLTVRVAYPLPSRYGEHFLQLQSLPLDRRPLDR